MHKTTSPKSIYRIAPGSTTSDARISLTGSSATLDCNWSYPRVHCPSYDNRCHIAPTNAYSTLSCIQRLQNKTLRTAGPPAQVSVEGKLPRLFIPFPPHRIVSLSDAHSTRRYLELVSLVMTWSKPFLRLRDQRPWLLPLRSSQSFIVTTISLSMFTVNIPLFPNSFMILKS